MLSQQYVSREGEKVTSKTSNLLAAFAMHFLADFLSGHGWRNLFLTSRPIFAWASGIDPKQGGF